ncbi:MAG TPA: MarR family transcriptional regulator [Sphingomonas sp.]|nr:MarR family transcriptional regulator [Sphingomonas sp.]
MSKPRLLPYRQSLAGSLLLAREAVMAPLRGHLRQAGVTEQQWRVLRVLAEHDHLDPSSLASLALLHAPSVTRILRELEERMLIERGADAADRRRSITRLTPGGRALVDATAERTTNILTHYETLFGAERLGRLRSELIALAETIRAAEVEAAHAPNR